MSLLSRKFLTALRPDVIAFFCSRFGIETEGMTKEEMIESLNQQEALMILSTLRL